MNETTSVSPRPSTFPCLIRQQKRSELTAARSSPLVANYLQAQRVITFHLVKRQPGLSQDSDTSFMVIKLCSSFTYSQLRPREGMKVLEFIPCLFILTSQFKTVKGDPGIKSRDAVS